MYVLLFLTPQVFEIEKLMLFLISYNSVTSTASSVVILSEDILNLSCPVLLNPQLQKVPFLWEQVSSAQVKLLCDVFTSLQWNKALLQFLTHLSVWEVETYFFLWLLMPQSRRARLPRCKLLLFCDVQGRPHSLPRPSYRMYVCMPVYICICLTLDHSDFDVLVKIISILHWNFPLKGYCQYNKLLTKASAS